MLSAAALLASLAQGTAAARPFEHGPPAASGRDGRPLHSHIEQLDAVRDLLKATQAVTVFDHVGASVAEGVVTLTGKVTSKRKRDQLETEVATVPGVRQVVNRIAVLSSSPADEALRRRVARAIYGHASFRHYAAMTQPPIRILVDGERVTLAGDVRNAVERLVAISLASEASGGSVDDQLRISAA